MNSILLDRPEDLDAAPPSAPLRVMFINTTLEVGGAETLLVNLVRRMDRTRFAPEICCLKDRGKLGAMLADEMPVFDDLLRSKYDVRVFGRLTRLFRQRRIDAVVTVGAGDKMFWGRWAARRAGVPVVCSALHSTGWPDGVGRLNRLLTPLTDAFIAVAPPHGRHLIERERFPADRVRVIPNGVDVDRFCPRGRDLALAGQLGIPPEAPVAAILAALRPEKDHEMFLHVAAKLRQRFANAHFLVIGDGPLRSRLEQLTRELSLDDCVHFLGVRSDVPALLSLATVVLLTSRNEANPVSILEALACGRPVVATRVGSVPEMVLDGRVGYLVEPQDVAGMADRVSELFTDSTQAERFGVTGRQHVVAHGSLERMVWGYEQLLSELHERKTT